MPEFPTARLLPTASVPPLMVYVPVEPVLKPRTRLFPTPLMVFDPPVWLKIPVPEWPMYSVSFDAARLCR
jgi:hypothetical protein